jgi:hypothetical protein
MDGCNYSIIFIIFYIISLAFVMKTHFHYIGYISLLIVYLINILYVSVNYDSFSKPGLSTIPLFSKPIVLNTIVFLIVFFSLYSLIRMIDTYNYLIKQNKTYDIPLSIYHKNNVRRFNITFIISNVVLMFLVLFNSNLQNMAILFLLALSFVSMLLQIGFSTSFSGMKYDFISKYSRDIQAKYDTWVTEQNIVLENT